MKDVKDCFNFYFTMNLILSSTDERPKWAF